jgi:hypothetical protein
MHTSLSHIQSASDLSIGLSLSSEQHDLRANHFTMRTGVLASSMAQLPLLGLAQLDYILAGHYHKIPKRYGKVLQPARNIFPA